MSTLLSSQQIADRLHSAGRSVRADDLRIEKRDDRLLAQWPGNELAWIAHNDDGKTQLVREGEVLGVVRRGCSFAVPEETYRSADDTLSIRTVIVGRVDPAVIHQRIRTDGTFAKALGRYVGESLAQLHACPVSSTLYLPREVSWPMSTSWMEERLPRVLRDHDALLPALRELLARYQGEQSTADRVLAHTDLGLHNIVFDEALTQPLGIIDFESAAYVDRHFDFRYLVLDFPDAGLLDTAMSIYEALTGIRLDRRRIVLYNAACACCYLAFRDGVAPETRWCGRTLQEDLAWTREALANLASLLE